MAVEIKLIQMYKVVVYDENGNCCSYGNNYASTKEKAVKMGIEIYNDHKALESATKKILNGETPKIYYVTHNYTDIPNLKVAVTKSD